MTPTQLEEFKRKAREMGAPEDQIAAYIAKYGGVGQSAASLQAPVAKASQSTNPVISPLMNNGLQVVDPTTPSKTPKPAPISDSVVDEEVKTGNPIIDTFAQAQQRFGQGIGGAASLVFGGNELFDQTQQQYMDTADRMTAQAELLRSQGKEKEAKKFDQWAQESIQMAQQNADDQINMTDKGKKDVLKGGVGTAANLIPSGGSSTPIKVVTSALAGGAAGYGVSEDNQELQDIATGAAVGGAIPLIADFGKGLLLNGKSAGNRVISRLLNPFTAQFDQEIADLARAKNVDLPVSAQTNSNVVKQAEALAQKSFFGNKITNKILKASNQIDEISQNLTDELAKPIDKKSIGNVVKSGFSTFEDNFNKTKTSLYNSVPENVLNTDADTTSTIKALNQIIAAKEKSAAPNTNVEYYKTILERLQRGSGNTDDFIPTYDVLKKTRTSIGEKMKNFTDPVATGDSASLKKLYASLSDDLEETIKKNDENAYQILQEANTFYAEGISKINSDIGKSIKNSDPEKLIDTLLKPNSESDISLVKSIIGEDAISELQQGFTSKLYNDSVNARTQKIDLTKLRSQLKKYGEGSIKELLGEEGFTTFQQTVKDLEDVERLTKALNKGSKPAEGSQTAFLLNSLSNLGLYAFNPKIFIGKMAGEFAMSQLFTSETGRKLLTEGLGEIAQNSGAKLHSPIDQTVARLIGVAASTFATSRDEVINTKNQNQGSSDSLTEQIPATSQENNEYNNQFQVSSPISQESVTQPSPTSSAIEHPIPAFRNFQTKQEMVAWFFGQGSSPEAVQQLSQLWDQFAPGGADQDQYSDQFLTTGVPVTYADKKFMLENPDKVPGSAKTNASKFAPAVSRALSQLETISGINSEDSIFQGGSTTIGKTLKSPGIQARMATDATFAERVNQYKSSLSLAIGAINQMLGAGTLNEGEATRLLETVPDENTSIADARAWFKNARAILGVQ